MNEEKLNLNNKDDVLKFVERLRFLRKGFSQHLILINVSVDKNDNVRIHMAEEAYVVSDSENDLEVSEDMSPQEIQYSDKFDRGRLDYIS